LFSAQSKQSSNTTLSPLSTRKISKFGNFTPEEQSKIEVWENKHKQEIVKKTLMKKRMKELKLNEMKKRKEEQIKERKRILFERNDTNMRFIYLFFFFLNKKLLIFRNYDDELIFELNWFDLKDLDFVNVKMLLLEV
jgi:hypothetical protein